MKILQLNTWGGRLQQQVIDLIKKEDPDFVCLQEVVSMPSGDAAFLGVLQDIQTDIPNYKSFFSTAFSFRLMQREAEFGNCIMSKKPFVQTETIFTNGQLIKDFDFKKHDYNIRTLQHVTIKTEDGPIHLLNHHGHHIPGHKNGDKETLRQCEQIADYVKKLTGKVILTGDFNLSPKSDSLQKVNNVLQNLCIHNEIKTTRTIFTHKKEVCDYIFVSDSVDVTSFKVLDDLVSDHKALVAEFN